MSRTKTKRIKALKEFIELEKCKKEPDQEYIDWAEEEIAKLEAYLKTASKSNELPCSYISKS